MANRNDKNPGNVPGPFYVDTTCIDCDRCRELLSAVFRRDDELGTTIVYRQPGNAEEMAQAQAALEECPTDSIGSDGRG